MVSQLAMGSYPKLCGSDPPPATNGFITIRYGQFGICSDCPIRGTATVLLFLLNRGRLIHFPSEDPLDDVLIHLWWKCEGVASASDRGEILSEIDAIFTN
jgi:hypothetical protein